MRLLLVLLTITVLVGENVVLLVPVRYRQYFSCCLPRWQQRRLLFRRRQALEWQQLRVADEQRAGAALQLVARTAGQQTARTGLHDN